MKDLTKKSGVIYLAVFLFLVCAIATALMAAAKLLTDEPIAVAKNAKTLAGLKTVLDGIAYDNDPSMTRTVLENGFTLYTATNQKIPVAYVILGKTAKGYGGDVEGLISFNPDGSIRTYIITKHNETPGIGTKVTDRVRIKTITDVIKGTPDDPSLPGNRTLDSFTGKKAEGDMIWKKDDGIHFVSGATVSSNAANDLAWNAAKAVKKYLQQTVKTIIKEVK
ncbi:MAG: FMN-binding protein [Lentisphaeria bacterium]|nr:FMN-binding protein [Lentisphaeria bacterium]